MEGVSLRESLRMEPERLAATHRYLSERAAELGLPFHAPELKCNTRQAHLLAEYAKEQEAFDPFRRGLFEAYFVRGENLADEDVLRRVLDEAGLDPDEAMAAVRSGAYDESLRMAQWEASQGGITGVPAFVIEGKYLISGAQPYDVMLNALRQIEAELRQQTE